jgi:WD40 repeat protein/serine/threonine protein kinase
MSLCPYCASLPRFLDRQVGEQERRAIERHVESCSVCMEELERLTAAEGEDLPLPPVPLGDAIIPDPVPDPHPDSDAELPAIPGYRLQRVLGRGGRGIVYLANHARLRRWVALKMIRAGAAGPRDRARFRIEAEALARLQHPNIIPIHEVGDYQGLPFFAMEYVEGGSLNDRLQDGLPPPRDAARLVETLARAMHHAHQRGVLHRDLTPANVLLQEDRAVPEDAEHAGQDRDDLPTLPYSQSRGVSWRADVLIPKISDFGLAKFLDSAGRTGLTEFDDVMGTPSYMAPEQAAGKMSEVGTLTDVYALGAILYRMLTGHAPFEGGRPLEIVHKVRSEAPPPPRRWRPEIPADLEAICLKCLEKEPHRRYQSAEQLADELGRFLRGESLVHTRRVGPGERLWRWCRRNPALAAVSGVAGAALVAVLLLGILFSIYQSRALDESRRLSASLARDRGLGLCETGEIGPGLLWLARGLDLAPEGADDLQRTLRANLAGWRCRVNALLAPPLHHPDEVWAVAFSPDGRTLVTGSKDGVARLWDAQTGAELRQLRGHDAGVHAVAFSPDGRFVVTGGEDGTARRWDPTTGRELGCRKHACRVKAVAVSRDGQKVLTAGGDTPKKLGEVFLWDAALDRQLCRCDEHQGLVCAAAFSPDGKTVLTAGEDGTARLWDVSTGAEQLHQLRHPRGNIRAVAFSPDGQTVLTGGYDGTARLWDARTGAPVGKPFHHPGGVLAVAFSSDGRTILTAGEDRTARFWDVATRQPFGPPLRHQGLVRAVAFRPDGGAVLTGSTDGTACLREVACRKAFRVPLVHQGSVWAVAFSPDGKTALVGSGELTGGGEARLWEVATGRELRRFPGLTSPIRAVAFHPDGRRVLTGSTDRTARLWDSATGRELQRRQHAGWVLTVAFSPDGKAALSGSWDGTAWLWETDGKEARRLRGHRRAVWAAVFSPDGNSVLTGGSDQTARLWDATTGAELRQFKGHQGAVLAVAFSPDGRLVLTAGTDRTARLWETSTGKERQRLQGHQGPVRVAAFSPDGGAVLTGSADGTARLWDAVTGQPIGPHLLHQGEVQVAAFSPDGRMVLSGSRDGTARLWDRATGKPLGPPIQHSGEVWAGAFGPDGRTVLTGTKDGTARLWQAPVPVAGPAERFGLWAQVLTGMELDAQGVLHDLDAATWCQRRGRLEELGGPPMQ